MVLLADISAEFVGTIVAFALLLGTSLVGIVKCVRIVRRPTAHALCVVALMLVLVGLAVSSVSVFLSRMHWLPLAAGLVMTAISLILYIAAFVTATIGWIDFRKHREAYSQGTAQAKWAIGLSMFFLTAFSAALYSDLKPLFAVRIAAIQPVASKPEQKPGSKPTPPPSDNDAKAIAGLEGEVQGKRVLDSYNVALYMPGEPWHEFDSDHSSLVDVQLAMKRESPEIWFLLIAERLGIERCPNNSGLADLSRERTKTIWSAALNHPQHEETYNGMTGVYFDIDGTASGKETHKSCWVTTKNGFAYQLMAIGPASGTVEIDAALRDMCRRFHQMELNLIVHSPGFEPAIDFQSPAFGYRVELANTEWAASDEQHFRAAGFEHLARLGDQALLAILAVQLPDGKNDLETVTTALIHRLALKYPGPDIIASERLEIGKHAGRGVEMWDSNTGARKRLLLRIIVGDRQALLVCGWLNVDSPEIRASVESAINRVVETPRTDKPSANLTLAQRNASALVNNEMGVEIQAQGDMPKSVEYFKFASELNPTEEQIFSNYISSLMITNRAKEALAVVTERASHTSRNSPLRAVQAKMLFEQGDVTQARKVYADLFANGYFNENNLMAYVHLAIDAAAYDEAIGVMEKVLETQPTVLVRRSHAVLYSRKGKHDKAIALLEELYKQFPTNPEVPYDLAETYEIKGDFSAAVGISQKLLDSGRRDEATLVLHGRNQLKLRWYSEAKKTFEAALKANPTSRVVKDYLAQASNLLGEGDNSLVKAPVDPVEIPEAVRQKIQEAKKVAANDGGKYDATETLSVTGIDYQRGKPMRTTVWREVKIFTTGGVTRYSSMVQRFNPAYERVFVNKLAVFDAAGKLVAEGSVNNYYVLDDGSSGEAKQHKVLNMPVPGLKPGYTLRFVVTIEELVPADSFRFQDFVLSSSVPMGVGAVFAHGDVAKITSSSTPLAKVERTNDLIYCVQANPQQYFLESSQPLIEYHLPIVWMGESGGNWEEIGKSYLKDIEERLVSSEETRQLAAELTKDCHTQQEKLLALASHVQNAFTYQAIEFGRRAMIPNPPSQTLHFKYGDCKDHAVLLRELLDCAKVPAYLALVKVGGHLRSEMPSLDQFNHMVVYVPKLEGAAAGGNTEDLILDCTDKYTYPLLVPPVGLADKQLLVLDPGKPRIVQTQKYPDDAARLVSQRKIRVTPDADGGAVRTEVDEHITLNQFLAPGLRSYLRAYEPADRTAAVQAYFNDDSRLHLDHVAVENLDDFNKPLVLDLKYAVPEAFHLVASAAQGKTLVGRLPSPWEKTFFQPGYVQQRKSPFEFMMPVRVESTVEFELPKGFEFKDADKMVYSERTPFMAWASRSKLEGNAVKLEYRARRFAGRHQADEYPKYYEDAKKALGLFDRPMMIQAVGVKPTN